MAFAHNAVLVGLLLVASAPRGDWAATLDGPCDRCMPARTERREAPVPIPQRAVIYSFVGEFATKTRWWQIDLDTGGVILREWVSGTAGPVERHVGVVDAGRLASLRTAAARLWRQKWTHSPPEIGIAPGTYEEAYVVSGARLVRFSRLVQSESYVADAVDAAVKDYDRD
jgi:hypothetical protein